MVSGVGTYEKQTWMEDRLLGHLFSFVFLPLQILINHCMLPSSFTGEDVLLKHSDTGSPGTWQLGGGKVQSGSAQL